MCDSLVATGAHSISGATLFGKNSDRKEGECQPFLQFPSAVHPRGARLRCTHIEIPQVAESYRVMGHSPWWVWGFEHGVNEHGVAIGNQTVFSNEPVEEKPGLIGMDLVRLGLERGRDARESLEVIAGLIETYGQGGAALAPDAAGYHNSFMIADPQQAWVMETSNRRWAARRIECGALTNHITLGDGWQIASRDLDSFARSEGWWRSDKRLDMAAAYRNPHVPGRISEGRLRRSTALLQSRDTHDVSSIQSILRDHGNGLAPPRGLTTDDEAYFTLCMHSEPIGTTTASLVAPLPTDRTAPWAAWISFGTPCTGIFLPVYIEGIIPTCLARGTSEETSGQESAWWVFERLRRVASRDFDTAIPLLREGWTILEEKIEHERESLEREVRRAVVAGERDEAAQHLTAFMARTVRAALERAQELESRLADALD